MTDPSSSAAAEVIKSIVSLVVGLAWPATLIFLVLFFVGNADGVMSAFNKFLIGKQSFKARVGPTRGLEVEIVTQQVASGLTQQATKESGATKPISARSIQQTAYSAVSKLVPDANALHRINVTLLWVDDHPENNAGLQFAFQSLGITVICVSSNDGVKEAFLAADSIDVVITDMHRDSIGLSPAQPEAGLETVRIIREGHPGVPVIIYAGGWAAAHANDKLEEPVKAITNDPRRVFEIVTDIAQNKIAAASR